MATILIDPIETTSKGGYAVILTGIDPTGHDWLVGSIKTPSGSPKACWDIAGYMRGGTSNCNLDMRSDEMREIIELFEGLKKLF